MDELAGVENDLQVGVANEHQGSSSFDKVYSKGNSLKQEGAVEYAVIYDLNDGITVFIIVLKFKLLSKYLLFFQYYRFLYNKNHTLIFS